MHSKPSRSGRRPPSGNVARRAPGFARVPSDEQNLCKGGAPKDSSDLLCWKGRHSGTGAPASGDRRQRRPGEPSGVSEPRQRSLKRASRPAFVAQPRAARIRRMARFRTARVQFPPGGCVPHERPLYPAVAAARCSLARQRAGRAAPCSRAFKNAREGGPGLPSGLRARPRPGRSIEAGSGATLPRPRYIPGRRGGTAAPAQTLSALPTPSCAPRTPLRGHQSRPRQRPGRERSDESLDAVPLHQCGVP